MISEKPPHQTNKLGTVLLRLYGFSVQIHRLPTLDDLPLACKIYYAILREDIAALTQLLQSAQRSDIDSLLGLAVTERLAGFLLSKLYNSMLDVCSSNELGNILTAGLKTQVQVEAAIYFRQSKQMQFLLDCLAPEIDKVLFIKGPTVAESAYPSPQYRFFSDFDLVVPSASLEIICAALEKKGFVRDLTDCSQLGVGPCLKPAQLLLQPHPSFVACDALTYDFKDIHVEVKLDPIELGLSLDTERIQNSAIKLPVGEYEFRAPRRSDQLMIALCHQYRDSFLALRTELDCHLLAAVLNDLEWNEFTQTCKNENLEMAVFPGLCLLRLRLDSAVPDQVLAALQPRHHKIKSYFSYMLTPRFLWNQSSIAMLTLSALFLGATARKFAALRGCWVPSRKFLSAYYKTNTNDSPPVFSLLFIHWCVLVLPAGIVRRTVGRLIWPESAQWGKKHER